MPKVEVRVFATFRQLVKQELFPNPESSAVISLDQGATLGSLLNTLGISAETVAISLVNGLRQPLEYELLDGDRVGLFPPVGGG